MKSLITKLFLTFGSVCLLGTGLYAQSYRLAADIPFAFHANDTDQQAGHYIITEPMNTRAQMLQNLTARTTVIVAPGTGLETNMGSPRLIFHRYGSQYFLAEIWNDSRTGTKLHMQKAEKAAREAARPATVATVSLGLMASR